MRRPVSRRAILRSALLGTIGASGVGSAVGSSPERVGMAHRQNRFDPTRHGFGFRNWSSRNRPFETPEVDLPRDRIETQIKEQWADDARSLLGLQPSQFGEVLLATITTQLRETIVQNAGTNGHCYGMALAAQRYYERPGSLPLPRESAAEIMHPTEPIDAPEAPVYREILDLQSEQFLRFRSWLGRRAMLWPDRIDLDAQLADVRAVVDTFDTAVITVLDSRLSGHQLLVYDYESNGVETILYVYDPNRQASTYEPRRRAVTIDRTDDGGRSMQPYGQYTHLLFNRYDRIEAAADRSSAAPSDHLEMRPEEIREALFPTALVTVDTADVSLSVSRPSGRPLERLRGSFMDRSNGVFPRLRFGYGIDTGRFRIALVGKRDTEYDLRVRIAGPDGVRVDDSATDRIESGETHSYVGTVPDSPDELGGLERVDTTGSPWRFGAVALGGSAVGAGAYHILRDREDDTE